MKNILNIVNDYIANRYYDMGEWEIEKEIKELNMQIDYEYSRMKKSNSPNDEIRKMISKYNTDIYEKFIVPKKNKIKALKIIRILIEDD